MSYEQEDHYGFFVTPKWLQDEPEDGEEQPMSQPGAKRIEAEKFVSRERIYDPTQGPKLPLLTEEERSTRASYWDRQWEARSGGSKRGWRKAHRNPQQLPLMLPAAIAGVIVVLLLVAAYVWL